MYKGKTFLVIIPARGGSKGIPNKNIIDVEGKPLIKYTIDAAIESKYVDRIVVSTDSEVIAKVSVESGAEVPFLRPAALSTDSAKTIDALIHAVNTLKEQGSTYDYLVLLQPTQPLRQSYHIDEAIEKIVEIGTDSLVSLSPVHEHPILMRTINKQGMVSNLLKTSSTVRRQDFPDYYKVNGSIYINKINEKFDENLSLNDNKLSYIMEEKYDIDIDEPFDLEVFKLKLRGE
ncbi:acylneuraminate cytidylyltransferase family protein [Neobacillus drentensis]|uniref:acylneuraminate cytidylyltransferase family protein n=1 Tax=Neobacillus drentensis TaxID=220684 RepID=UPI002FFDF782